MARSDDDDRPGTRSEASAVILPWAGLSEDERERVRVAQAFLRGRLSERHTLDWALRLAPDRHAERHALNKILNAPRAPAVKEPFATAWRLVEESWSDPSMDRRPASAVNDVRRRLHANERSGALVLEIANLFAPRLEVKVLEDRPWFPVKRPRRPRRFQDLLDAGLTSISIRDFGTRGEDIGLSEVVEIPFLTALASALMSAVDRGIHIATRLYGEDEEGWRSAGTPVRVYFERVDDGSGLARKEVDAFNRGLALPVKFLYAVVLRIADLDVEAAMPFVWRWRFSRSWVYRRLWAAAARDPRLASAGEVADFHAHLDDKHLWDLSSFPEIAELRVARFAGLDEEEQTPIIRRLRRGPRRRFWPRNAEADKVRTYKRELAALELKRVELAGGALPARDRSWLLDAVSQFPALGDMKIEYGLRGPSLRFVPRPSPRGAARFDALEGVERLRALESALSGGRHQWGDSAGGQARAWLQNAEHALLVVSDLESASELADEFPLVWESFAWFHSPPSHSETEPSRDASIEASRVLRLIGELSDSTLAAAIDAISHWLSEWSPHAVRSEAGTGVWMRVWPVAVEATNTAQDAKDDDDQSPFFRPLGDAEIADIDTLGPPAARLVRALLWPFKRVDAIHHVFADGSLARPMLDSVVEAPGHSGLVARCVLMKEFPALLRADPEWTNRYLVGSLSADDRDSILLWRAVAEARIDTHALQVLGDDLLTKVRDRRLGEDARESLIQDVIFEVLEAFRDDRVASRDPRPAFPAAALWGRRGPHLHSACDEGISERGARASARTAASGGAVRGGGQTVCSKGLAPGALVRNVRRERRVRLPSCDGGGGICRSRGRARTIPGPIRVLDTVRVWVPCRRRRARRRDATALGGD